MSYFEDQHEAWLDNNCEGSPTDYNPDEYYADKISECEAKGHGKIKIEVIERDNGMKYKTRVCQSCNEILEKVKEKKFIRFKPKL